MIENVILKRTYAFAICSVKFCYEMQKREKEFIISRQLLKSATSIGANMEEAQGAISRTEFVCKTPISLKEAKGTHYWLRIVSDSEIVDQALIKPLIMECTELIAILTAILKTAKGNMRVKQ